MPSIPSEQHELRKVLERERSKLQRQLDSVKTTEAMIQALEGLTKTSK